MKTLILLIALIISQAAFGSEYYFPSDAPPAVSQPEAIQKARDLAASVGGKVARVAATGSMAPTITASDLIVYKPAKVKEINVGDIVVVMEAMDGQDHSVSIFTHRVYRKAYNGEFWTKGDHNKSPDNWTSSDMNLKGVVVYIVNGQTGEVK